MVVPTERTFTLDPNKLEPFEIGAWLLAILAFPGPDEEEALKNAAGALCSDVLRETMAAHPSKAIEWRTAYPHYADINPAESRRRLRTLKRRLRDRMVAARMSLGYFEEGLTNRPAKLPPSMKRHSVNQLAVLVQCQSGESDPENVERRAWHDTRPVIHLAAAVQIALRRMAPAEVEVGYPLADAALHEEVIQRAQIHEQIALLDQRFGLKQGQLVRIRWGASKTP